MDNTPGSSTVIDCACVIHSNGYSWDYVDKLYNMLNRALPQGIRMHVYTEPSRTVPAHMIKHRLKEWPGIKGPRRSWWYKMQLFNPEHFSGNLLYLDLDTVIFNDLSWAVKSSTDYFWALRDFKYLQLPGHSKLNSSMMWWNVEKFSWVWDQFAAASAEVISSRYRGDQDYIDAVLPHNQKRLWEDRHFQSWRWQAVDGGYNFARRQHYTPGTGAAINPEASVLVFHGTPKPHEITDPALRALWH